jgi:protein SCO1/2
MKSIFMKYRVFLGIFSLSSITLYLFYGALKPTKTLPIFNPSDVNPELVDSTVQYISKYHTIGDFSFVNQTERPSPKKIMKARFM